MQSQERWLMKGDTDMKEYDVKTYILHGYWNSEDSDAVEVILITTDETEALNKLREIEKTKGAEFHSYPFKDANEYSTERIYEIEDNIMLGRYAKFYITEENIKLDNNLLEAIYKELQHKF